MDGLWSWLPTFKNETIEADFQVIEPPPKELEGTASNEPHDVGFKQEGKKKALTSMCRKIEPVVLVHGGCGMMSNYPDAVVQRKLDCVKKAARAGYSVLKCGGTSCDAVEAAIRVMEDDPVMNAGVGSVLNYDGEVEACASIMTGDTMQAGAVGVVKDIAHPISLARLVMDKTRHVLIAGEGAYRLAAKNDVHIAAKGALVTKSAIKALERYKENPDADNDFETWDQSGDTVGAVAIDRAGHLAAGVSTGGLNGRLPGRVSDAAQIGSGAFADDEAAAVSVTGDGDAIARYNLAHQIALMPWDEKKADAAVRTALQRFRDRMLRDAGAICINRLGEVGIGFTTDRMAWCCQTSNILTYGINKEDVIKEFM